ncbi:hypothetical protein MVEN_01976400 [Mycena venus]|uniref:Uncharacterized protein n=1 Tax=Mycena venus TaxID=2733690 RepID=A0A8H6XDA7_9AGAR|nr:hypothetical protein MVEN_01976400 [Mycena venus]
MSRQGNEPTTIIANIYGGTGGVGGVVRVTGGTAGAGEGPITNINGVQNLTTNIVNQGHELEEVLYKWLESPPDTEDRQYELQRLRHEATGCWLLCDVRFIRWKTTPGSLWIKGISGTGKSVLCSTVIQEITMTCPERSAVAYFYFDFRNERQCIEIMLRSIIWQLSGRSPSPYSALHRLYQTLGNGTVQPQYVDLQEVLENLLSELDRTYIVIDGLDECRKTERKVVVQFICSLCHPTKNAIHLLFTSQPLEEFKNAFKDVTFIELGSVVSTSDIRSFIGSKVPRVGNWASDDIYAKDVTEQIVQKSNGMFHLAACLLIELGHCHWEDVWEKTLTLLPADLFGIYSHFFTWAKGTLPTVFIQAIFRWLVFSTRPLTLEELADAIAFPLSDPNFDFSDPTKSIYDPNYRPGNYAIFKVLEGLIAIKHDGSAKPSIVLAHSSVKDYILSPEFQWEFGTVINLTKDVSHKFIAQTCIRYLLLFAVGNHSMTLDTLPDYPISLYAAKYWFHHLRFCNDQDQGALLPLTMHLLEDGSSQHAALYRLCPFPWHVTCVWDGPISPALCMCSEMGYTEGVRFLLIEHNTPIDQATEDGKTALHLASKKGNLDIARLLIEHNASVDLATKDGETALHLALEEGHLNIARLLIEHSTSIDQATNDGRTAFHIALLKGHLDIAQLLIAYGTSVYQATSNGQTALHLASRKGQLDVARLFIEHGLSVKQATNESSTTYIFSSLPPDQSLVRVLLQLGPEITSDPEVVQALLKRFNISPRENLIAEITATVARVAVRGKTACEADTDLERWLADNRVREPRVWPVILWVAFQVKAAYSSSTPRSMDMNALAMIESNIDQQHIDLWQWDDADEQLVRQTFISQDSKIASWIDRYPPLWREYIRLPDSRDWTQLEALTRQPSRPRSNPTEYDAAIRVASIVLWTSSNSVSASQGSDEILTLDRFVAHMIDNAYMVDQLRQPLPQRFISCVWAFLLKFGDKRLDEFRALIDAWKTWDVITCLRNFCFVLSTMSEFSKSIADQDLPKSVVNVVIHTDIRCICAQIVGVLRNPQAYQRLLDARDDEAQQLIDLFQDLLDYPPLDSLSRPIIWKVMRKLSKRSGRHPRCFAIPDFQLNGSPVTGGAFADIWKCHFQNETVCVKAIRVFEKSDMEALLKAFHKEALIWRQHAHPNLLPFFGIYSLTDPRPRLCLVSPWMENGDISKYLQGNPAGINRLTLVLDVAIGLAHLHSQNFVHGDLKAMNVLVTRSGRAVIADFGQSSVVMNSGITALSSTVQQSGGTLRWQAPELLKGSPNSVESDVYAFAGVCYEIFTGEIPFFEVSERALLWHILSGNIPQKSPCISDDIWAHMEECWDTDPEKRPVAKDIVTAFSDPPISAVPTEAASDWEPSYTAKFRASLQDHTLFLLCGEIDT